MATFAEWKLLKCDNCTLSIESEYIGNGKPAKCPHCSKKVAAYLFPALMNPVASGPGDGQAVIGSEASCYYHVDKQAAVVCDDCGRFLCALCDVELNGRHLCTSCLENASNDNKLKQAGTRYVQYDSIALTVALAGVLLSIFSFITAPVALYFVIRYWKAPLSPMPRSRWRFVLAALVAVAELVGWGFVFLSMTSSFA